MGKRMYRSKHVKDAVVSGLLSRLASDRLAVGIDVAKRKMMAAVMDEAEKVHETVRWTHPEETPAFVAYLEQLRGIGADVTVAMEPSGAYGDALRFQVAKAGFSVSRVSPKRTHDAAEVYDGVNSHHDAKSAAIVAKLHLEGRSRLWPMRPDHQRQLDAAVQLASIFGRQYEQNRNRLEGLMARHWPEVTEILELGTVTLLELLREYGGPAGVAARPHQARELMRRVGGRFLAENKVERVLESARRTLGMPAVEEECELIKAVATEARRNQKEEDRAIRRIEELVEADPAVMGLRDVVGGPTAGVLVATAGDPRDYDSPTAYVKTLGLNLRVNRSGESKVHGLHITKRGSGVARRWLYMAALRLLQNDRVVRAWYAAKVGRLGDAPAKLKVVVALMRKLAAGLWHVARGNAFDARKLFDVRRLDLETA